MQTSVANVLAKRCTKYVFTCIKYAINLQLHAHNVHKNAITETLTMTTIANYAVMRKLFADVNMLKYAEICTSMQKKVITSNHITIYVLNMQKYAKNMQNMHKSYIMTHFACICTPHFADRLGP